MYLCLLVCRLLPLTQRQHTAAAQLAQVAMPKAEDVVQRL